MRPRLLAVLALALVAGGCSWVKMDPQADAIRVVRPEQDLGYCTKRGEIAVSVKDQVGFYDRNALKVRDELEILARNEAVGLGADTIQAMGEPVNGEQRFAAFTCGGR
ncbi:DUF4156 domain-containing protein [Coralloluteibacterium stylophorae]|uniref:DUF4156 domain-containing protein n=1 Tax=Coralloluteibacterium stylophorae TaxID=1776034 RepID=A0A8J8AYS9_9GAMM|nr:DUF4156 domain-containing protein [Coralloluteibacterium stylophorae]MBS7457452.1 DUF4156 domain-containing protein [Coralloluteibacterium stylophorae]